MSLSFLGLAEQGQTVQVEVTGRGRLRGVGAVGEAIGALPDLHNMCQAKRLLLDCIKIDARCALYKGIGQPYWNDAKQIAIDIVKNYGLVPPLGEFGRASHDQEQLDLHKDGLTTYD